MTLLSSKTLTKTIPGLAFYSDKNRLTDVVQVPRSHVNMDQAKDMKRKMENWNLIRHRHSMTCKRQVSNVVLSGTQTVS